MASYAKEGGHWYTPDGKAAYTQPNKSKGGERPTTIRDAIKLGLYPSVTGVMSIINKPPLNIWITNQNLWALATLPDIEGESLDARIERAKKDAKEQTKKAAEVGTRIHGKVERYYAGESMLLDPDWEYISGIAEEINMATGEPHNAWSTERTFASQEWKYGGCVDLHNPRWVVDLKGKDGDLEKERLWDEHYMQLAAYREGLGIKNARCGICFFSRTHPGVARFIEADEGELFRGRGMFLHALGIWKYQKRYRP
jgi:hypothetical protein